MVRVSKLKNMNILADLASRPRITLQNFPEISLLKANEHRGGHPNSIAWLLWHTGREIDIQLADLDSCEQLWPQYAARIGLGDAGEAMGYDHTPEQARAIVVTTPEQLQALREYTLACCEAVERYVADEKKLDLDQIVDDSWDPPVSRGVRLVSLIDDAIAHLGQVAYLLGCD